MLPRGFAEFDSIHLSSFRDSARINKTGAFNRSANLPHFVRYHRIRTDAALPGFLQPLSMFSLDSDC
jgi:hypothetical protein